MKKTWDIIKILGPFICFTLLVVFYNLHLVNDLQKQSIKLQKQIVKLQKSICKKQNQNVDETRNPCFLDLTKLTSHIDVNYSKILKSYHSLSEYINNTYGLIHTQFEPSECATNKTIAIIIPVRYRTHHLHLLLGMLHPLLQKQFARYRIYVIHQSGYDTFNKGVLMNTGFLFAREDGEKLGHPYDCYIFHDVDLIPESEFNIYRCGGLDNNTRRRNIHHMAHTIDKFNYSSMCCYITVGGVLAFTNEQFVEINGYSNRYWGWGGEDDDMSLRINFHNFTVERNFGQYMRYTMIPHRRDKHNPLNPERFNLLYARRNKTYAAEGLNSLKSKILSVEMFPLYVNVSVDVGNSPQVN